MFELIQPIMEGIKWVMIISCIGFWAKYIIDYLVRDEEDK